MNGDILYRWDKPEAGVLDPTRQIKANDIQKIIYTSFPEYTNIIKVFAIKFPIKSSGKSQISNEEYLSTSKGSGGHIVGFLNYKVGQEAKPILNYTTFMGSQLAFKDFSHPNLFIIPGSGIQKVSDKLYSITTTSLEDIIKTCDGIVKFYPLGSLMDAAHRNMAEVDFIGNGIEFEGFMIQFKESEEEEEEEEDEPVFKRPSLFLKGGMKRGREELREVPSKFDSILDQISKLDPIQKIQYKEIAFDSCPAKAGRRKTKRRRRTIRKKL